MSDSSPSQSRNAQDQPPVSDGEIRTVGIKSLGHQGDEIGKIDRGYVVIVPDTEVGERVTIRFDKVQDNVAFADVIKHHPNIAQDR